MQILIVIPPKIFVLKNVVCFLCLLHILKYTYRLDFITETNILKPDLSRYCLQYKLPKKVNRWESRPHKSWLAEKRVYANLVGWLTKGWTCSLTNMFLTSKIQLGSFVGHPKTISAKRFWILISRFRREFKSCNKSCPLTALYFFCRRSPCDHFCHLFSIWLLVFKDSYISRPPDKSV